MGREGHHAHQAGDAGWNDKKIIWLTMPHVIKTQILDVLIDNTDQAFELQQSLNDFFYAAILPALEKTFDQLAPGDQLIYIDKMEINLGIIEMNDLQKEVLSRLLVEKFIRQLKDSIHVHKIKNSSLPVRISVAQQWISYMDRGYLPWNTIRMDDNWHEKVLEGLASDNKSIELLRSLIRENSSAVRRIVWSHKVQFLSHLVEALTARNQAGLDAMIRLLFQVVVGKKTAKQKPHADPGNLFDAWQQIIRVAASSPNISESTLIGKSVIPLFNLAQLSSLAIRAKQDVKLGPIADFIRNEIEKKQSIQESAKEDVGQTKGIEKKQSLVIPEEGLFIAQAGLVLLHVYLQRFFGYLGLIKAGQFKDQTAQQKAVLLLYWMAAGKTEFKEHELVMHKVLCGYPLNEPVDPGIALKPEELEAAGGLLEAVIEEWSILKNTSKNGLREEFLQRNGKLISKEQDLRLLVESSAVDVLLDHLPWNISLIKLPWMPQILSVEWR
jgi:hypothetical protein